MIYVLLLILVALSVYDWRYRIIPNAVTLPGIVLGAWLGGSYAWMGLMAGFIPIYVLAALYFHIHGKEGIGGGDVKLLAMVGAFVGWHGILVVQIVAALLAIHVGRFLKCKAVPFAPFVTLATVFWIVLLHG